MTSSEHSGSYECTEVFPVLVPHQSHPTCQYWLLLSSQYYVSPVPEAGEVTCADFVKEISVANFDHRLHALKCSEDKTPAFLVIVID